MKKQKMRFISAVLAACMMTSVLPVNALALGGGYARKWRNCTGKRGNAHNSPNYGHENHKGR